MSFNGNDVLIDDILVRQIQNHVIQLLLPIVVDGKGFRPSITGFKDVRCNGEMNGEDYSICILIQ
jgi:hypothetical protein